jgi:hypothetical protein
MCHLYYGEKVTEGVQLFGMDNTPLCPKHLELAEARYEAAVRDLNTQSTNE